MDIKLKDRFLLNHMIEYVSVRYSLEPEEACSLIASNPSYSLNLYQMGRVLKLLSILGKITAKNY